MKLISSLLFILCSLATIAQDYSVDRKMGAEGKASVEATMGIYQDPSKTKIISSIGSHLVSNLATQPFPYEFFIVDSAEPNAFALPGGYIFFTRGILVLANSEDELAGVMGHEIIHSYNRHSIKQRKKSIVPGILMVPEVLASSVAGDASKIFSPLSKGGEAMMASHSRKDEYEADDLGVQLSAKSGYQPDALGDILSTLNKSIEIFTGEKEKSSYFNDHPYTPDRVSRIKKESANLTATPSTKIFNTKNDFLKALDGVIVGENPGQGIFKGDWFIHPDLKFKISVPFKWLHQNNPTSMIAVDTTQSVMMMLEIEPKAKTANEGATAFADAFKKKTGVSIDVNSDKINGLTASQISFTQSKDRFKQTIKVLWVEYEGIIYRIVGSAIPGFETILTSVMESFTSLPTQEGKEITKRIIRVIEANDGEKLKGICDRSQNLFSTKLIAAINGIPEDKIFKQGELLKVIIEVPY
jgi:predicted Zn-dependent protease